MNLKVARAIKNYTQQDLSTKSGVGRPTISLIENRGFDGVTVGVLKKLATALEISVTEFMSGND